MVYNRSAPGSVHFTSIGLDDVQILEDSLAEHYAHRTEAGWVIPPFVEEGLSSLREAAVKNAQES